MENNSLKKLIKYQTKYNKLKNRQFGGDEYIARCNLSDIKIINAHGSVLNPNMGFLVPLDTNLITITKLKGCPVFFLNRSNEIGRRIELFYTEGNYLFRNNDQSNELSEIGRDFQASLNIFLNKEEGDKDRIYFKNHLPWQRQILLKRETNIFQFIKYITEFSSKSRFNEGKKLAAYYFPEGINNLSNYRLVGIISHHSAPGTEPNKLDPYLLVKKMKTSGYLRGGSNMEPSTQPYHKVLCTVQIIESKEIIHNISASNLVLAIESTDAIKYNNSNLSFKPSKESTVLNECDVKCITPRKTTSCHSQSPKVETDITNLINQEGPGTYIIIACRGTDELSRPDVRLLRQRSAEN